MDGLTAGRTVHYVMDEYDAEAINGRRLEGWSPCLGGVPEGFPQGAQAHVGNEVLAGDHCPMIITKVHEVGGCTGDGDINGQVLLDGSDTYWAQYVSFDADGAPGTWHWIEKA